MPDTHLAMPRSLSAELAQTPELLAAHAPMTTSDASPNGTAAAAAAFARLLASGDQAMQSETENTVSAAEHKPLPLRAALLVGTAVTPHHPDANILELGRQREAVIREMDSNPDISDEEADRLGGEWLTLDHKIMALTPKTGAGIAVQLAVVWRDIDEEGPPTPDSHRSRVWLWKVKENAERVAGAPCVVPLHTDTELLTAFDEANKLRDWMDGPEPGA